MARLTSHLMALLLFALNGAAAADRTGDLPPGYPDREMFTMEVPARGMSMERVLHSFGEPLQRLSPVGEPPITRWVYDSYTVYFEDRHVIHTVLDPD